VDIQKQFAYVSMFERVSMEMIVSNGVHVSTSYNTITHLLSNCKPLPLVNPQVTNLSETMSERHANGETGGFAATRRAAHEKQGFASWGRLANTICDDDGNEVGGIEVNENGKRQLFVAGSEPHMITRTEIVGGKKVTIEEESECSKAFLLRKMNLKVPDQFLENANGNRNAAAARYFHFYVTQNWGLKSDEFNISGHTAPGKGGWYHEERIYTGIKQTEYDIRATKP